MSRSPIELIDVNRTVADAFDEHERRPWSVEVLVVELAKQLGDLSRAVLSCENYYLADRDDDPTYEGSTGRIGNELADILYCVMRIADHYSIDLEDVHLKARAAEWRLLNPGSAPPWMRSPDRD